MTKMSDLPKKLVEKTLSNVPVASLGLVRSTCKKWNDLSKNRIFGNPSKKPFWGFMMKDFRVCSLRFDLREEEGVLVDPSISIKQVSILNQVKISKIFHCHGLLLCVTDDKSRSLVVWNPYLGQTRWIQPRTSFHRLDIYALGYDSNNNHKILRFVHHNCISVEYEIYDFSSNSWRVLDITPDWEIEFYQRGATLKGNTYFFAKQRLAPAEGFGAEIDTTETEDFLLSFDFTAERFGPRLPLPFHSYFDETVTLSCVRDEQLAALLQLWDNSRVMEVWVTNNIDLNAVSWSKFLKVDMAPLTGFTFDLQAASFFIDEQKKVAVVFDLDTRQPCPNQTAYIIGQDGYFNSVNIGEATRPDLTSPRYCVPLVCSSSYAPSLVQLQINKTLGDDAKDPEEEPIDHEEEWIETLDEEFGGTYYYNTKTHVVQYLPDEEWIETLDEESGHTYYYNTKTHVLQREPPASVQEPATTTSVLNLPELQNLADTGDSRKKIRIRVRLQNLPWKKGSSKKRDHPEDDKLDPSCNSRRRRF